MIGHPAVAEIMGGEGFDWIGVDMEHTSTCLADFYDIALALKGSGCDLLVRLHSCDPVYRASEVVDDAKKGGGESVSQERERTLSDSSKMILLAASNSACTLARSLTRSQRKCSSSAALRRFNS